MTRPHRVVVTGFGVVAPNGVGVPAFGEALLAGRSGVSRYEYGGGAGRGRGEAGEKLFELKTSAVGACRGFDPASVLDVAEARRVPRMIPMALAASREALAMAGIEIAADDFETQRSIGVALGTGGGGLAFVEEQYRLFYTDGKPSLYSITSGTHGNLSSELSIHLKLRGPSHVLSTGCTSSTDALGYAMMLIRSGMISCMVAGGADSPIAPGILSGFEKLRVISTRFWEDPTRASRPFQKDRDGFVLGEGAFMFVLESLEHARARGATVIAELVGYGSTCDAYHRVAIAPDVAEPVRAIRMALADAGMEPDAVDYVNLHGTSTDLNDRLETSAIKTALGEDHARRTPMSATKSLIGHPQGACGAAGVAATLVAIREGKAHPTLNQDGRDDGAGGCDLDYIAEGARAVTIRHALCNCIAFGSKNSALVLRSPVAMV